MGWIPTRNSVTGRKCKTSCIRTPAFTSLVGARFNGYKWNGLCVNGMDACAIEPVDASQHSSSLTFSFDSVFADIWLFQLKTVDGDTLLSRFFICDA